METVPDPPTIPAPRLAPELVAALRARVAPLADATVSAIAAEVPGFAAAVDGPDRTRLEDGVRMAYDGFLGVLADGDPEGITLARARRGAYVLGRDEARSHRSIDTLLSAYRIGSRVHWQELSRAAVEHDLGAQEVAALAAMVFAYADRLSAASVTGHAEEAASATRLLDQRLERLTRAISDGLDRGTLERRAQQAHWAPPETLTAIVVPFTHAPTLVTPDRATLRFPLDQPGDDLVALFVPDRHRDRRGLLDSLRGSSAVVGPTKPWWQGAISLRRALRALEVLPRPRAGAVLDTEAHLRELVVLADPESLTDLRRDVLAPLRDLPDETAGRLAETLLTWLLLQGRREDVAAALHIHPQTVRYRMNQIRERFGERLRDADRVHDLILALGAAPAPTASSPAPAPRPRRPAPLGDWVDDVELSGHAGPGRTGLRGHRGELGHRPGGGEGPQCQGGLCGPGLPGRRQG
ncbi:MAG TPA: helix-turn-helix domain-containing protein [Dermatophilaceae bacterium]|nr:helix-turn-helix domain-containing protein [Dermatophilaceae bacterium]